jgi:beta-N-acetylhexosaminidase
MAPMRGSRGARRAGRAVPAVLLAVGLTVAGCAPASGRPTAPPPSTTITAPTDRAVGIPAATPAVTPPAGTARSGAAARVARMSARRQAGAVLMTAATVEAFGSLRSTVRRYGLSGVMLRGRSSAGTATVRRAVRGVTSAEPTGLPLLVATDQEGGLVQVLRGPGFPDIPSAVRQATWPTATLRARSEDWGRSLAAAGVNLDLGPVADTPCAATLHDNPPVADLLRNYGTDPDGAGRAVGAVVRGLHAVGVASTVKHFPGLGCVRENTDTTAGVVDDSIGRASVRLRPFRAGIAAGAGFVMVSSATYRRIDGTRPALYSSAVLTGMLRQDLGFRGVIMSDDVGGAMAVRADPPGRRATRFVAAGGDLLLDIVPADVPGMVSALADRAASDPGFAERLAAAATRVITAREALAPAH